MKKILVVDDEENMRLMLQDFLSSDYEITLAAHGREALTLMSKTTYDLLITDLVMPEMNGIELVISVKDKYPQQKVIAISGGGGITGRFDYLPVVELLGADKILAKPFELSKMLEYIKTSLA